MQYFYLSASFGLIARGIGQPTIVLFAIRLIQD